MQTFVPEGHRIIEGFELLDYRRLGKQRVETWQILNVLRGVDNDGNPKVHKGWVNHPATKMWVGHATALAYYGWLCSAEWAHRGYKDTMADRFLAVLDASDPDWDWPEWLHDDAVRDSHRSNLIRKDPEYYGPMWPHLDGSLEYVWPVQ